MNENNNESEPQQLILLNKYGRILGFFACGIIFLENVYIIASLPYGFLLILIAPIDAIAIFILGLVLILEYLLNRSKNCTDFLLTGVYLIVWSGLTFSWRLMLPDLPLTGSETGGDLQFSLITFLLASIWFSVTLWKLINLLHNQTEEGRAIQILRPILRKQFHSITKLYIQLHLIFSIITVIGFGIGNIDIMSLGIFGKIIVVPILGIVTFGLLPVLYMTHRMADIDRTSLPEKLVRDYSKSILDELYQGEKKT